MGNGLPPGKALVASCNLHKERPERPCKRCLDAIMVNRMNPGWGKQEVRTGPVDTVEYFVYEPWTAWAGPGVFVEHRIARDRTVSLVPRATGRHRRAASG